MTMAFALASASPAVAAGPCQADLERLCGDVEPGDGRVQACLDEKKGQVSVACKARIDAAKADLDSAADACADDTQTVCGDVEPGQGRVLKCLIDRKDQLSGDCRAKLARAGAKVEAGMDEAKGRVEGAKMTLREKLEHAKEVCTSDSERLCADVAPGGGRVIQCLKQKEPELGDACRAALK